MSVLAQAVAGRLGAMARREEECRELATRLFGAVVPEGADPVTAVTIVALHRDALARAGRCGGEDDLLQLLRLAEAVGDEQLARAAAAVGLRRSYVDVVEAFVASRLLAAVDVEAVWNLLALEGQPDEGVPGSWH